MVVARKPKKNLAGLVELADDLAYAVKTEDTKVYIAGRSEFRQLTAAAENLRIPR
jgi:hypothetical protein